MNRNFVLRVMPTFLGLACSGCASIINSTSAPVAITSTPADAHFVIKNEDGREVHSGETPESVTLKKYNGYFDGADYTVTFTKPGYDPVTAQVNTTTSAAYALGNLVFGGLLGYLVVDPLSGAMWEFNPEELNVSLEPAGSSKAETNEPAVSDGSVEAY